MKPISLFSLSLLFLFFFTNCKSNQSLKHNEQLEKSLREQIIFHVKSLNEGNEDGLEKVYSENYEGLFPVTKFESKAELISKLVESQAQQQLLIEFEIIEISASASMAYAILDWIVFEKAGSPQKELLYNKKHLQIWELKDKNWQLKRSLFYN